MAEEGSEITIEAEATEVTSPKSISELKRKMQLTGTVARLELYGAFIDIGVGTNAILHISKLPERVNRISDALSIGDEVSVWILNVDRDKEQITVSMLEPLAVDWGDLKIGQVYNGKVTRLERFGAFMDIGAEKEGLVHISELSHDFIKHPSEAVKVGEETDVQVLGFSKRKRRIDLSRKALLHTPEAEVEVVAVEVEDAEEEEVMPTAMEIALRRAMTSPPAETSSSSAEKEVSSTDKVRAEQDEILSRTLKLSEEFSE
ncbi:MAG TPA: S1 RNA-binding domain-containing protein [candidate division Zixibacteria bacterium]|nr:S1 RNA-binding domain-containing protein [candidate division Zixibacteria bacterium]